MIVIGLTGSIGMGKTMLASQLRALGARVCSADAIVHLLLSADQNIIRAIGREFPGAVKNGEVDRRALGEIVFSDEKKRRRLEEILHPPVIRTEDRFVAREKRKGTKIVVLDIPLLFETGGQNRCDLTLVATAPGFLQRQRVMLRPRMTEKKFRAIVESQMSDATKRRCADIVVKTGLGRAHSFRALKKLMRKLHAA